jgi:large subunit ribosomal protein L30e
MRIDMVDTALLSKFLKGVMKTGKVTIGARENISSMKGNKAIVYTKSTPSQLATRLVEEAKKYDVAIVEANLSSAEFARMIGKPYRVSALGLRSISEADLKSLLR